MVMNQDFLTKIKFLDKQMSYTFNFLLSIVNLNGKYNKMNIVATKKKRKFTLERHNVYILVVFPHKAIVRDKHAPHPLLYKYSGFDCFQKSSKRNISKNKQKHGTDLALPKLTNKGCLYQIDNLHRAHRVVHLQIWKNVSYVR